MTTWRASVDVAEVCRSASWDGAAGLDATVVVATCNRASWLPELLAALEQQQIASLPGRSLGLEVILVDDCSDDDTLAVLRNLAATSRVPLLGLRTVRRSGPSAARNAGADRARTDRLLLTDDDCLPQPGWAAALVAGLAEAGLVQGRTVPVDEDHGPWDRSITVTSPTPLYETCNLGLDASAFRAVGGFADLHLLPGRSARGFGEDAELGSRVAQLAGRVWAQDAVVHHRWLSGTFADHLAGRRRLEGFPGLAGLVPEVEAQLVGGTFLSSRTLVTDAGLLSLGTMLLTRRPLMLLGAVTWAMRLAAEARHRPGRPVAVRAAQLALADTVGAVALLRGSRRAGRTVL